ncbi:MAG: hypothetical protein ACF8XB_11120 [Planctomycetota bacterium JB042]
MRLASALVLAAAFAVPSASAQVVLDFEGLSTSPSGGVFAGNPLIENGYRLTVTKGVGIHAFEDGWQNDRGSSNGSTTVYTYVNGATETEFRLEEANGAPFTIASVDLAETFNVGDFAYSFGVTSVTIVGQKVGGSSVQAVVPIDGVSDGQGGAADFQTHVFSGAWSDLVSVTFTGTSGTTNVYMNFDNIVLGGCASNGVPYGTGCPGTGGFTPVVSSTRCPGQTVTLEVDLALGGANAFLFAGVTQVALPMGGGCTLNVVPLLGPIGPLPLGGAGAGNGTVTLVVPDPVVLATTKVSIQVFVDDSGGAMPFSNTSGVELTFTP